MNPELGNLSGLSNYTIGNYTGNSTLPDNYEEIELNPYTGENSDNTDEEIANPFTQLI